MTKQNRLKATSHEEHICIYIYIERESDLRQTWDIARTFPVTALHSLVKKPIGVSRMRAEEEDGERGASGTGRGGRGGRTKGKDQGRRI